MCKYSPVCIIHRVYANENVTDAFLFGAYCNEWIYGSGGSEPAFWFNEYPYIYGIDTRCSI